MNALVGVRANKLGSLGPTAAQREQVSRQLRAGRFARPASAQPAPLKPFTKAAGVKDGTATREVDQELSRDAFLQLLVLEMQNQDPLEPMDNQDMLAQLAQFSSLEQMTNLNDSFEGLAGNIDQLNFISATNLLGRTVSGLDMNGAMRSGVVEQVHLDGSMVYLQVDGELMSMAGVIGIDAPAPEEP